MVSSITALLAFTLALASAGAFTPVAHKLRQESLSKLFFGIPSFSSDKKDEKNEDEKKDDKSIGLKGLAQLITAGMGSPFLGDFEGVEEESGKMMFSLEANNLVDEKGESRQTKMPYFERYVFFFFCMLLIVYLFTPFEIH